MLPRNTQVAADGLSRVTDAFASADNFLGAVQALLGEVQELEDDLSAVQRKRFLTWAPSQTVGVDPIENPTGDDVDRIGALVGELRLGRPDGLYIEAIRARIAANASNGTANDLQRLTRTLVGAIAGSRSAYTEGVLSFQLEAFPLEGGRYVGAILTTAKPAGVGGDFIFLNFAPSLVLSDVLAWDHTTPVTSPDFGSFGHVGDADTEGVWADTVRL